MTHLSKGVQISGCLGSKLLINLFTCSIVVCRQAVTPDPINDTDQYTASDLSIKTIARITCFKCIEEGSVVIHTGSPGLLV